MILYTPLSQADVFPSNDNNYAKRQYVSYQGKMLYVEETEKGTFELLQLLSTDPHDFMDSKYTPGNIFM